MCLNGHCVCNNCKKNIASCPQCKNEAFIRCLPMEKIHSKLRFPCRYQKDGCSVRSKDIQEHEYKCKYNSTRPCPLEFDPCDWTGSYAAMCNHVLEKHKHLFIWNAREALRNNDIKSLLSYKNYQCFFESRSPGMLRLVTTNENGFLNIIVQYVGYYEEANEYYRFQIAEKGDRKMLTCCEKCYPIESVTTTFATKGFLISHKQLQQFSQASKCSIYIYI